MAYMNVQQAKELLEKVEATIELLDISQKKKIIEKLEGEIQHPDFWNDTKKAQAISQELSSLQEEVAQWEDIQRQVADIVDVATLAEAEGDTSLLTDIADIFDECQKRFDELEFYVLFTSDYAEGNAILSLHAGAGGVDAQDWAEMLQRMILRFCDNQGWKVQVLEQSAGQEAGIKSATFQITGRYAYGYLQSEHGTHRLVRISPFDAEGMRHTSFANIEVIPDLGEMADIDIDENELRIDVFRAGGHGGQSVNTTDSAVRIVHEPTGLSATCQNEKSQHQNKAAAMAVLRAKLVKKQIEEREAKEAALKGEYKSAEWGNQIRSYVLHPYKMVKDHRTTYESNNPDDVLNGNLQPFMEAYLRWKAGQ